ncbi:MAG: D-alanine:D-lactate ligase-like protein [Rhizobiaceae bacterium]|nr:D-alanine:D-lactate ligase-like protein [Rhizobiaceae bacterium]
MAQPVLILAYETEAACRARLANDGIDAAHAREISSYLAQSTDLSEEFGELEHACARLGMAFLPVELDDLDAALSRCDPSKSLVWTLTDGIAYFRGSAAPALARLRGFQCFGSEDSLFALCQDKFRSGAVLHALGLPCPKGGLARDGAWLVEPPASALGWFVKPNRLGAKIGIYPDSHVQQLKDALALSRRVFRAYRDDVVVQPYVGGRNARASFLGVEPQASTGRIGVGFVESGSDFQTMQESLALYGESGAAAKAAGTYAEPVIEEVGPTMPHAEREVRAIAARMMAGLGLRDVFSLDLRVEPDGAVHLIEFEVCPGLPCFDFRDYCRRTWGLELPEAMARAARARLAG